MSASSWKLVMSLVDKDRIADVRDTLQRTFEIGQGQANDIVNHVPLILIDNLGSREHGEEIIDRLADISTSGAVFKITDEPLVHTPKLTWPEMPTIARTEAYKEPKKTKKKDDDHEQITMTKYNFVVNTEHIFHCPECGAAWRLTPLAPDEKEDAIGQQEIARILERHNPSSNPGHAPVSTPADAGFEPMPDSELAAAPEGAMDMGDFKKRLSDYRGSHVTRSEDNEAPEELAAHPGTPGEEPGEVIFEELEALPEAKPPAPAGGRFEEVAVRPVDEKEANAFELSEPVMLEAVGGTGEEIIDIAGAAGVELVEIERAAGKKDESLNPNEALDLFGKTKEKHETRILTREQAGNSAKTAKPAEILEIPELEELPGEVLPGDELPLLSSADDDLPIVEGDIPILPPVLDEPLELEAAPDEPPVLTPIIDDNAPELTPAPDAEVEAPAEKAAKKKKKPAKAPKPKKATRIIKKKDVAGKDDKSTTRYSFVLSKVAGPKKRDKAAAIIAELKNIPEDEANDLLEGSFTKVLRGVTKKEAEAAQKKFKNAGLTGRVTKHRK